MAAIRPKPKAVAKLPRKPSLKHTSRAISRPTPRIPQHSHSKKIRKPKPLKKIHPRTTLKRKFPLDTVISTPGPKPKTTQIPNTAIQNTTLRIIPTPPSTQNLSHPRQYIVSDYLRFITPGCIVWLPAKAALLPGCRVDARIHDNAFEHPAVIVSAPSPKELRTDSVVEIAIMTSCGGRTLAEVSLLSHRSSLMRVKTAAHPYAKVDLNLRNGLGMQREHSYVGLRSYGIELRTLGFYMRQVGQLCLTAASLRKLVRGVEEKRESGEGLSRDRDGEEGE